MAMLAENDERPLTHLLDAVEAAAVEPPVLVQDILDEIGERSFSPVILVIALLMVSPLSGIPGSPTVSALLIVTIATQSLVGRRHLWLPRFLTQRHVPSSALRRAIGWLRGPGAWFDRHSHRRWRVLTTRPMRKVTMLVVCVLPLHWPFLELLPFVTSLGAGAISLLAFGLVTRDGLFVLLGYAVIALLSGTALRMLGAL